MKHHYAISNTPLRQGATVKAMCGAEVPKAQFAAMIDLAQAGDKFTATPARGLCRKCFDKDWENKRLLYVVASGQEAMTEL